MAWPWVWVALLCALGFQTPAQFCQGKVWRLKIILAHCNHSLNHCLYLTRRIHLFFVQTQYGNPMVYVTENGVSEKMLCTELCDEWRIQYYKDYINEMLKGESSHTNEKCPSLCSLVGNRRCNFDVTTAWFNFVLLLSNQRWSQCEGLHCLVPAGQVWVGWRLLWEVWPVLCGLQEQKQASLSKSFGAVLQTHHQL